MLQPRQHLPQLHEEPFARSVTVGKHVEGGAQALGEVTGRTVREDITNRIFERFCVGK